MRPGVTALVWKVLRGMRTRVIPKHHRSSRSSDKRSVATGSSNPQYLQFQCVCRVSRRIHHHKVSQDRSAPRSRLRRTFLRVTAAHRNMRKETLSEIHWHGPRIWSDATQKLRRMVSKKARGLIR